LSNHIETLDHFRLLLDQGIGSVKIVGHRLVNDEIGIAAKLLAYRSEKIEFDSSIGSLEDVSSVLEKLSTCSVEINKPEVSHKFMMINSCRVSTTEIEIKLNEQYKIMFNVL
jgi:hypothetical protein